MQDYELTLQHVLWRLERLHQKKEVVTKRDDAVHRTTYGAMVPRINRLAGALKKLGVKPGDRVATLAWNNDRHLELYYAVPCMGAVLHTLNLRLFPQHLEFIINDAEDKVLFVDQSLLPLLKPLLGKIPSIQTFVLMAEGNPPDLTDFPEMLDYETLLAAESESYPWPKLSERMAAAMCYTSGTTGNPKGVVYSHRSQFIHTMGTLQGDNLGVTENDAILPVVPMFHANSWGLPYAMGMAGSKVVFAGRFSADPKTLVELSEQEDVTFLAGVPSVWVMLASYLKETGKRLPKVTTVVCGGSAVPRALMETMDSYGLRILHAWGMTETSPLGSVARVYGGKDGQDEEEQLRLRLTQGRVAPGVEIRITDPASGEELPWDGVAFGEIQVRGPWIARGYHNGYDPGKLTEDGWFRTGDVAKIDADGYIQIVDRTKDVIKSGGEWISSVELENAVMAHPKILEAAVIGLPHPKWDERPVVYAVPRPEFKGKVTQEEVIDFLRDKVAKWWLPDEVRFIDEVPKTSVGKFDKKVLRASAEPIHAGVKEGARK